MKLIYSTVVWWSRFRKFTLVAQKDWPYMSHVRELKVHSGENKDWEGYRNRMEKGTDEEREARFAQCHLCEAEYTWRVDDIIYDVIRRLENAK